MDSKTGAAEPVIKAVICNSMESNRDSPVREDPAIVAFDHSEATILPGEETPPAATQSAAPDLSMEEEDRSPPNQSVGTHPEHFPSVRKRKSVIEVAVALFAASLTLLSTVPGRVDEQVRVTLGKTISFKIFLFTDLLALVASLAVAMILAFDLPGKVALLMEIIMWVATACFLSALLAAGFVLMIPALRWIVMSFIFAGAMVVALLIYRAFILSTQSNTRFTIQMCQQHHLNAV